MVKAYLPSKWTLMLVGLDASIPTICDNEFIGSQIMSFDDSNERDLALTKWIEAMTKFKFIILMNPMEIHYHIVLKEKKGLIIVTLNMM